ncbi:response regulator [Azospira restricta]|uniref:Response regulator n=1 Tax=Azospira restricta TaxID=404405 RepID=A0A974SMC8_9RHOO|nr:response regulator [Azospira restricta]QRJ62109.1 response regulator [Azospira restricta]
MHENANEELQRQIDRIRSLAAEVLAAPDAPLPQLLPAALFDFNITSKEVPDMADAGEIARSLASLLHQCGEHGPDAQERLQVNALLGNLLRELAPADLPPAESAPPLVTPVAPAAAPVGRRIALFTDGGPLLVMLRETLAHAGFEPVRVDSLEALAATGDGERPVAVIADIGLCLLYPQCHEVFATLRRRFDPPPHLFCIGTVDDIPARLEAVRLGATRFLRQPVDTARLVAILKGVTLQTPTQPFRVMLVEDDPFLGEVYADGLADAGMVTCIVGDPLQVPAKIAEFDPDVLISDLYMPGCNGFELLALLRQDDTLNDTPIMLLSSEAEMARQLEALHLGADDFLTKPVDMELLIASVTARAKRARMLKRSRGEYRRLKQRLREVERLLPGSAHGTVDADLLHGDTIDLDGYVVEEVHHDDPGAGRA